jgi:hypothetical protein
VLEDAMAQNGYERLAQKTTIGCEVKFHGIPVGKVKDEVSTLETEGEYKYFLQRIRLYPKKAEELQSRFAYRWCYWVLGQWNTIPFGQYALLLSEGHLRRMLRKARKKGWKI